MVRPLLFRVDPERVHDATLGVSHVAGRLGLARRAARFVFAIEDSRLRVSVAGLDLANPLGLAAGFDKNGRAVPWMSALGFGHVEIGSVSAYPSSGNPRPRLFRIPDDQGIVVNYGVPNLGAEAVARDLAGSVHAIPLGINLVKTNDPAHPACEPDVYEEYVRSMDLLRAHADYFVLSLACPNSPGDRDFFDDPTRIHRLLQSVSQADVQQPLFLKLKPTQDSGVLREIVAVADEFASVSGFGINLPAGKPDALRLKTPHEVLRRMPGAVSGRPVEDFINSVLAELYRITGPESRYTLMAAGGVFTAEDAYRKIRLGASLVQLLTGLIYLGPFVVRDILVGLVRLLEGDGFESVGQAVGAAR